MKPTTKKILVWVLMVSGMVITVALGRWQLQRAAEKEQIMVAIQEKMSFPTLRNEHLIQSVEPGQLVHQPVNISGRWLSHRTVLLDNRQMLGKVGFFVMTPMQLEQSNWVVWVQRGWVQRDFLVREKIPEFQTPEGLVKVQGLIAPPPSKLYEFGNAEQEQIRQNLNFSDEQWDKGLNAFPMMVRQLGPTSEGLLRDWPKVNAGIDKHYGYAAQWFGICGLMGFLLLWFQCLAPIFKQSKKVSEHDG